MSFKSDSLHDFYSRKQRKLAKLAPKPLKKVVSECNHLYRVRKDDFEVKIDEYRNRASLPNIITEPVDQQNTHHINNISIETKYSQPCYDDFFLVNTTDLNNNRQIDILNNPNAPDKNETSEAKSYFSYFNPFNWFNNTSPVKYGIEEIEAQIYAAIETRVDCSYVNIKNGLFKIWTISANTHIKNTPIVMVHGYCGAVGLWIHNIEPLCENRPLYAFDLLGFGRSSRPNFDSDPEEAERQYIDSIEEWRKELKLESFILLGHSFGGFLASAYALRFPEYIKGLILVDPWGFPEKPFPLDDPNVQLPKWKSRLIKITQNLSPSYIFRSTGQLGLALMKQYRPDFRIKYQSILKNPDIIYDYLYFSNNQNPNGEYAFRTIADYLSWAKRPMISRIDKLDNKIPMWFVFGGKSWIDFTSGFDARNKRPDSILTSVKIIKGAGHHVYSDKPAEFNEYICYILKQIERHEQTNEGYLFEDEITDVNDVESEKSDFRAYLLKKVLFSN